LGIGIQVEGQSRWKDIEVGQGTQAYGSDIEAYISEARKLDLDYAYRLLVRSPD
jgi:hypothetical protein